MKLVLTGSIGMGKSTVSAMFAEFGVEIWSADAVVKRLYRDDPSVIEFVASHAKDAVRDGTVDFDKWRAALRDDPALLGALEDMLHPKVFADREAFLASGTGAKLCEIPLYFETGAKGDFDYVVVVSAAADVQRARVLARGTMSAADFEFILSRQVPDAQKRAQADFVISTDCSLDETRASVKALLIEIGAIDA